VRLVVIVPTLGRPEVIDPLIRHLEGQHRPPDELVLSAPAGADLGRPRSDLFPVTVLFGRKGLCAQRNRALEHCLGRFDLITFFDDDFLPADDYLCRISSAFRSCPDYAVAMGHVVRDGAHDAGLSFEEGLRALRAAEASGRRGVRVADHPGAYGCNMTIRERLIGGLRFDERLPLYGWQEDIDFTSQLRRFGRVVGIEAAIGVHLGLKGGRVSGVRLGYSQIVNPVYLVRKGTMPFGFALSLVLRNLAANLVRSLRPEPYIDRRGRLRGNLLAAADLLGGRIEPERILQL
jgi:hypothetical protein